jgi:hypothetical protein
MLKNSIQLGFDGQMAVSESRALLLMKPLASHKAL